MLSFYFPGNSLKGGIIELFVDALGISCHVKLIFVYVYQTKWRFVWYDGACPRYFKLINQEYLQRARYVSFIVSFI